MPVSPDPDPTRIGVGLVQERLQEVDRHIRERDFGAIVGLLKPLADRPDLDLPPDLAWQLNFLLALAYTERHDNANDLEAARIYFAVAEANAHAASQGILTYFNRARLEDICGDHERAATYRAKAWALS